MRLLTALAAALAAFLDMLFGFVRSVFSDPDPAADIDRLAAEVHAEIDAVEAEDMPMFTPDEAMSPRVPKAGDDRAALPVEVARGFLSGDNTGFSRLPRHSQAWLVCAAEADLSLYDATDAEVAGWLSGSREHPSIEPSWVAAVLRGEHATRPAPRPSFADAWSPTPAPAF